MRGEMEHNHPGKPIIIAGAGVSGLLLAQHLRRSGVPFRLFERDGDLAYRGLGWGLTLHWSLPHLRSLLPEDLIRRLPEAYVDRLSVEQGRASTFPFFDLGSGELRASTPMAPESERIRVTRDGLRRLLATGLDIEWGRGATGFESADDGSSVTVRFEDGTSCAGCLLVACDGGASRLRTALNPDQERYQIPVRVMGVRVDYTAEQIKPMRDLDPFFLQGTNSQNGSYVYFSMLDAPGNTPENKDRYTCQIIVSWPVRAGFFGKSEPIPFPATNADSLELFRTFAETWAEPFRSLVGSIPADTEVKHLELLDWPPPKGFRGKGRVALVGDAFHAMAMYRGEGANHAIVDVADLVELVIKPHLLTKDGPALADLRPALDKYEDAVVDRARPGVLASRRACLDAHEWGRISEESPLLSRRAVKLDFDESELS